jgi:hypothetical protein
MGEYAPTKIGPPLWLDQQTSTGVTPEIIVPCNTHTTESKGLYIPADRSTSIVDNHYWGQQLWYKWIFGGYDSERAILTA